MTDTPRKDGPRTEARIEAIDRALLYVFQLSGKDYEKMRNWRSAEALIAALEQDGWTVAEAAVGPRDDGLDVERLARAALHVHGFRHEELTDEDRAWTGSVAAEYLRLAATTGAAPPESEERS